MNKSDAAGESEGEQQSKLSSIRAHKRSPWNAQNRPGHAQNRVGGVPHLRQTALSGPQTVERVRIPIADDHEMVRQGLRRVLENRPEWEICAEASTGREALELARELRPDICQVLRLIGEGKSSKEAASALSISLNTVETHRTNLMRKLQLHSVSELVHFAIRNNLVRP